MILLGPAVRRVEEELENVRGMLEYADEMLESVKGEVFKASYERAKDIISNVTVQGAKEGYPTADEHQVAWYVKGEASLVLGFKFYELRNFSNGYDLEVKMSPPFIGYAYVTAKNENVNCSGSVSIYSTLAVEGYDCKEFCLKFEGLGQFGPRGLIMPVNMLRAHVTSSCDYSAAYIKLLIVPLA